MGARAPLVRSVTLVGNIPDQNLCTKACVQAPFKPGSSLVHARPTARSCLVRPKRAERPVSSRTAARVPLSSAP